MASPLRKAIAAMNQSPTLSHTPSLVIVVTNRAQMIGQAEKRGAQNCPW
ncbi:hypothetical protein [Gimesia aquarii]|nr:hypothetical protein [Gimesia aquarii]